jgi:hypothetical protein
MVVQLIMAKDPLVFVGLFAAHRWKTRNKWYTNCLNYFVVLYYRPTHNLQMLLQTAGCRSLCKAMLRAENTKLDFREKEGVSVGRCSELDVFSDSKSSAQVVLLLRMCGALPHCLICFWRLCSLVLRHNDKPFTFCHTEDCAVWCHSYCGRSVLELRIRNEIFSLIIQN